MSENAAYIRLRCFFKQSNTPPSASTSTFFLGGAASAAAFFSTSNISRHFHRAFLSLTRCLSYSARLQFIAAVNQLTISTIAVLTAFLQLKYQGGGDDINSPFSTHPTSMHAAVSCSAVYYIASAAALRFPLHPLSLLGHHLSAYMSVASLASVLLSDWAAFLVYAVFGFLSAAELLCFWYCKLDYAEFEVERRGVVNSSRRLLLQRLPI